MIKINKKNIMKKTYFLLMIAMSLLVFNSCSEDVEGTKDINFVSFESNFSLVVNKNSTANTEVEIYTTQFSGSDRIFDISVDESSSADPASYTIPLSITIPANTNVGTFNVSISDTNISTTGETLVLNFEAVEGVLTGEQLTINMARYCPLEINDFLGSFIITEKGYGDYGTTITLDATVPNRISVSNFWDWTNDLAYYDFNPETGVVTMPSQVIVMGDGASYTCFGSGTYNACAGTFHMEYGGDVADTVHDFTPAP